MDNEGRREPQGLLVVCQSCLLLKNVCSPLFAYFLHSLEPQVPSLILNSWPYLTGCKNRKEGKKEMKEKGEKKSLVHNLLIFSLSNQKTHFLLPYVQSLFSKSQSLNTLSFYPISFILFQYSVLFIRTHML